MTGGLVASSGAGSSALGARNDAQWSDGTFVYVPKGVTRDAPVWLETVHEAAGSSLAWRLLVVLEEGAGAEVWHQSVSADAAPAMPMAASQAIHLRVFMLHPPRFPRREASVAVYHFTCTTRFLPYLST